MYCVKVNSEDQVSFQLLTLWTKSTSIVNDVVDNYNNRMTQKVEKKPLNEYQKDATGLSQNLTNTDTSARGQSQVNKQKTKAIHIGECIKLCIMHDLVHDIVYLHVFCLFLVFLPVSLLILLLNNSCPTLNAQLLNQNQNKQQKEL